MARTDELRWTFEADGNNGWVMDDQGRYLAELVNSDDEGLFEPDPKIREANGRLMAAAPLLNRDNILARNLFARLLEWEGMMGGWESGCWRDVKKFMGREV